MVVFVGILCGHKSIKQIYLSLGKNIPENEILTIDGKTIKHSESRTESENKTPHKSIHVVSAQVAFTRCMFRTG